jgi:hypothetical protein
VPKRLIQTQSPLNRPRLGLFAIFFGLVGIVAVIWALAAPVPSAFEPEDGALSGTATVQNVTGASGGKAVKFGSGATTFPLRITFYYPWFPETWGNLGDPFTSFHPSLGYYSSDDASVITGHIQKMTYAGMDAAIASWWGQGQHSEATRIPALLNNSANSSNGKNLKWAMYYEKESTGDPTVSELTSDLAYIKSNYASNGNYLKINNKPVIFAFEDGLDGCPMVDRWTQANAGQGFYLVLKVFSGYASCTNQPDNWHQYGPATARDSQAGHSFTISPGFWLKGELSPRLARDPARWATDVDAMIASAAPLQLVTTFNEWGEGSAVEPATEWASASGYGTYIDTLHAKLNSGAPTPTPTATPTPTPTPTPTATPTPTPTPIPDTTAPSVPTGVSATLQSPTGNVVNVTWNASTDTGGSGLRDYLVTRNGTVVATITAPTTTFVDTTTNYSTAYAYTVAARDFSNNTSAASAAANVTTPAITDTQAPNVPTTTASVVSTTQVTVSWTAVSDNPVSGGSGVKGYKVYRDGAQIADVLAPSTSTNDGPFSFVSGQSYSYKVLAYDVSGNSSAQSAASTVIPNPVVSAGNYCGNAPTGNTIDTVVVIAEENRSWSAVGMGFNATNMPYVHTVASQCGYFTLDTETNTSDNSATQYVGVWTGYDIGVTHVTNDCSPSTSCSYLGNNLFRAFRNAGVGHREYVEGATSTCSASGNAAKHIPELYMWDTTDRAACNAEVLPMSQFNFANPPTGFTFITPTQCNDGHDCIDSTVNAWLADPSRLPALFNTPQYKAGKVLVELWWDEDHPKPNLFACWSCKQFVNTTDPHYTGEGLLWLNLLNTPSSNLGAVSTGPDIRSILGTP